MTTRSTNTTTSTPTQMQINARSLFSRSTESINTSRLGARRLFVGALLVTTLAVGGCGVANQAIRSDFTDFNGIIQFNQSQQMLLNLVRLHYREPPMFLQAGSLTASYSSTAGGGASFGFEEGSASTYGLDLDYEFASKPTISYTPIEGKAYVTQFMTEVSFETFCLLVRAGWPITKLCELLVEQVTVDPAAPMRNHYSSPSYASFIAMVAKLQAAQDTGQLSVVNSNGALAVMAGTDLIHVDSFQLRSLADAMFVASKNIETPIAHQGRAKNGQSNGQINIQVSRDAPRDAVVWVQYSGHYFSIDNTDIPSKDTLALLMQLFRIQAAPSTGAPLLTIPAR